MSQAARSQEELACDVCGRFGAFAFDGKNLCDDCYAGAGSCCPGWSEQEEGEKAPPRCAPPDRH